MTNQFSVLKQIMSRKLSQVPLVASILLLFLPCYSWFLFHLYVTTIQIPREWEQFRVQERQIIQALREFKNQNNEYPEHLSLLVPDYLDTPLWESGKWSFHYGKYEDGEFGLFMSVPKYWFGWPARSACRSQLNDLIDCNLHVICGYLKGAEVLSGPIDPNQSLRQFWGNEQNSLCKN
jgi:hypothetical protein